ncbi:MAG TPA: Na+/H+ antiporter NhaA [Sphingomonadaceae bacterium]|nr:Na+/H+ antiporter NhaA [Sphingomonadaceae bacterium]
MNPVRLSRPRSMLRAWLGGEAAGGLLLMVMAAAALVVANGPYAALYFEAQHIKLGPLSLLHWINDALMALFFLIVGLEIKREMLDGQLSTWSRRLLPGVAACAGVAMPALIYSAFNAGHAEGMRGWAVPAATDIAFALGVLALLGPRVPTSLRVFLAAIAIIDDLIAVLIIALFYTESLALVPLALAGAGLLLLYLLNRRGVTALAPYLIVGVGVWWCVLLSGIHATLAGVALALTIPLRPSPGRPEDAKSPLHRLEHGLHPWVAFLVVPLFGFANAGVSLSGFSAADALDAVPLGVALGLLLGKQTGIFGSVALLVRLGFADLPQNASWLQLYGVALLCGIGFTMSLFIAALAFGDGSHLNDAAKLGILGGSVLSALSGAVVLRFARSEAAAIS